MAYRTSALSSAFASILMAASGSLAQVNGHAADGCHDHENCGKAARARFGTDSSVQRGQGQLDDPFANQILEEAYADTDVTNNDINIEVAPSTSVISGFNKISVTAKNNGLTQFTFCLRSQYVISTVVINEGTPGAVTLPGSAVSLVGVYARRFNLDRTYNNGEQFTVKINYSGTAVNAGGAINFTTLNGQTLVYTLSEPYYAATWVPIKDTDNANIGDNSDRATLSLAVTVPNTLKIAANGVLQGTDVVAGSKTRYRYRSNITMPTYLICFSAHPYNVYSTTYNFPGGSMPVEIYISPGSDTVGNRNAWLNSATVLETFRPFYGLYPFTSEKYGIYQFANIGGMEHQTNSGLGSFGESLVVHETAHQWWGDNVTCKSWADIWFNEGMATYSEALWSEKKAGSSGLPALFSAMAARRPSNVNGSVYLYVYNDVNRMFSTDFTYNKAAWVWHMLRKVMGDANFFAFLQSIQTTYSRGAISTAEIQAMAESFYGSSLNWYFQPWVYQTGAPAYSWQYQNVTVGTQQFVEVYVNQVQSASYPAFPMPIDVVLTIGGSPVTRTIFNGDKTGWYLVPVSGAATAASLDPNNWILATSKATTTWVNSPPKVIAVTPAVGSSFTSGTATPFTVQFHQNVTIPNGAITLVGATSGPRAVTVSYNPTTFTATITPSAPLPADTYTLTAAGTIVNASNIRLDGEITNPLSAASLPSGNGVADGAAIVRFTATAAVGTACNPADLTGPGGTYTAGTVDVAADGQLSVEDFSVFLSAFTDGTGCPGTGPCNPADITGQGGTYANGTVDVQPDGDLSVEDFIAFLSAFSDATGCP